MTDVAKLHEIQKIDANWEKVRKRLLQLQKLMAEPEEMVAARAAHNETEQQLHDWNTKQRDAELETQALEQRIKSAEAKLMSGVVRVPKELEALQHSVEALRRQRAGVEESGVEALLYIEEFTARSRSEAVALARQEKVWAHRHDDLIQEDAKFNRMAAQLKAQRSRLVESLPAADIELYEELRRRRAGVAVATIESGQCSACNVRVPTGVASTAKSGGVAYCTSCGRLLAG